ncbi:VOC family protein [Hoyosella sp. YIM 151337]|uniref:VOC family protein n=1 Tax=Hoyosella sp. YIM 151337 TaxID=2992742 RepID=UPI0022361DA4|nr:VOC family protein [Hoyosella sp. YIM 151337]MCW4352830.1 VOC family protein [Hoyosella sp. YIM 151337]
MQVISSRTILRPTDYDTTVRFYRDALTLPIYREYPGGTVLWAGQGLIEIAAHGTTSPHKSFTGALWLQVREVTAAEQELRAQGVEIVREPRKEPWGLVEMWVEDPDGIPIVFVEIPPDHPLRRDVRPAHT